MPETAVRPTRVPRADHADVELIPAAPFVEWLEAYREKYGLAALQQDTGLPDRIAYRYRQSLDTVNKPTDVFPRDEVEDALNRAGLQLWDLYPELVADEDDEEAREGFCPGCDDRVLIGADDRCLWCNAPTSKPMSRAERRSYRSTVCPECGGGKTAYKRRCRSCAAQARRGVPRVIRADPLAEVCPECGGPKSRVAKRCRGCFVALGYNQFPNPPHGTIAITDAQLVEARDLYDGGLSMQEVAESIFERTTYASVETARDCLFSAFYYRGWQTRGRGESRRLSAERKRLQAA